MDRPVDAVRPNRRRIVKLLGIGATGGAVQWLRRASGDDGDGGADAAESEFKPAFVAVQDDRCVPLEPLSGEEPVAELYDYTYPQDQYDGPPGSDGGSFSSEGTKDLQRDRSSVLFLYDGPDGLSLVVVHGHVGGKGDEGGAVSFTVRGLPDDGEWVVKDDFYVEDGEVQSEDRWAVDADPHVLDWAYVGGRTDGGAFRGLGPQPEIHVEPAFNEAAARWDDYDYGRLESWEVLSGDREDMDRYELRMDEPVSIRAGGCVLDDVEAPPEDPDEPEDPEGPDEGDPDTVVISADTDGNVETDGAVVVEPDVEVDGNVEAGSPVELGPDTQIDGNVETDGPVTLGPGAAVDGNVEAGDDVSVGPDAEIDGNVESGGDVDVGRGGEIAGNVEAADRVSAGAAVEIDGNVAGVSVDVDDSAEIGGSLDVIAL